MKRILHALRSFFFPPAETVWYMRLLPYLLLGMLTLAALAAGAYGWDYTNSPAFCGTVCHTMPPQYSAYQVSPHANVACVECHIGREFVGNQILRKAGDVKHIVALAFQQYEYPITANDMRPARETCEKCHYPEKFSDDSLREIKRYGDDINNSLTSYYLVFKTGGGSKRQGLGRGIHWHIENRVMYYATDSQDQQIPYIRVYDDAGQTTEYVDVSAKFDPATLDEKKLKQMDCITCHNRVSHLVNQPDVSVNLAMTRQTIDPGIPEIHRKGVEVLSTAYLTTEYALNGIAGLEAYYQTAHPDYYAAHADTIKAAITALQTIYTESVFPEQKWDWNAHTNNLGHKDFPGCMRCHDGKHLNAKQEAIRLECNLCHSIPVVATTADFVADIQVNRGLEPDSHKNANWIALHNKQIDQTCSACHNTENAGGTDNTSFCSNSACHGGKWKFAGLDAPALKAILDAQLPAPTPAPTPAPVSGPPTYVANIQPIFTAACGACHGKTKAAGLNLTTYADALTGGKDGPVIIPNNAAASKLVEVQSGAHFGQLTPEELTLVKQWIDAGAPEK